MKINNKYRLFKKKWRTWKSPTKIQIKIALIGLCIIIIGIILLFTDIPENIKLKFFKSESEISSYTDDFKSLDEKINELYEDSINTVGCNHILVIRTYPVLVKRKKFIFDNGNNLKTNRISLFFDENNNLIYNVVDKYSKEFQLIIENNKCDSIFYKPVSINCEVLSNKFIWKQTIYVNNLEFEKNIFNFPLEFNFDSISGSNCDNIDSCNNLKLGFNLEMKYPASFDAFLFTKTKMPFNIEQKRKVHNIFKDILNKISNDSIHFVSFTGDGRRIWR